MKDTYRHKGLRRKLVDSIQRKGIKEEKVLKSMNAVPRHFFMEKAFEEWAYEDKAFPIDCDQTISQPYTVAYQTALLDIQKREKVLEVGTGSGYQAAILGVLGARVFTIERQEALYKKSNALLAGLGFGNIRCFFRDGYKGLPEFAPFDKILLTAAAKSIPKTLKEQLKIGGIMVVPVGTDVQRMYKITRISEKIYEELVLDTFRFVPFIKGTNSSKPNRF